MVRAGVVPGLVSDAEPLFCYENNSLRRNPLSEGVAQPIKPAWIKALKGLREMSLPKVDIRGVMFQITQF